MLLLSLIFITYLILFILARYISFSHPLFIYVGMNLFTITGYYILDFPSLHTKTIVLYFVTIQSFIIGYVIFLYIQSFFRKVKVNDYILLPVFDKRFNMLMFVLFIIVIIGMGLQGLENASHGTTGNFFLDLRLQHLKKPELFGFYPHIVLFLQVYFLMRYLSSTKNIKKVVFLFLFISIYGSFWKMERTGMMMSIFALIMGMIIKNKFILKNKFDYKKYAFFFLIIIIIFISITMSRSSVDINVAFMSLAEYMFKGIFTFDRYVLPYEAYGDYGRYFGTLGDVFLKPFLPYRELDIYVDDLFTVYTYLIGPYIFGGEKLLYFTFFIFGFFYAYIYSQVLKRNIYFIAFYCFFIFTVLMSFFTYIYAWNHWIYFTIIISFIYVIVPKKKYY